MNPILQTSTNTVYQPPKKNSRGKIIGAGVGIFLLMIGLVSGLFLIRQSQSFQQKAWDCSKYHFVVSATGQVMAINDSSRSEPAQSAGVYINNQKVSTVSVPTLNISQVAVVGTVTVPANGVFNWEVRGVSDCSSAGTYQAGITASCGTVTAYDSNWKLISQSELSALAVGSIVRFTVSGTTTNGAFTKARFTINGSLRSEVTMKRPGSSDFYDEYTIPTGTTSFNVNAEIFHDLLNQWI